MRNPFHKPVPVWFTVAIAALFGIATPNAAAQAADSSSLPAPDWHPQWISASADTGSQAMPIFRKSFYLQSPIKRVIIYISGLGQYELRLNGRKVGNDELTPGWSDYRKTIYYNTYDVTSLLHTGPNAIGVLLGNGMYRVLKTEGRYTKFVGSYGPPKCAALLHIDLEGGQSLDVSADGAWKTAAGPITFSSTYGGEDFDARKEPQGWDRPGFDDSHWQPAQQVDGPGGKLYPELAPPIRVLHTYQSVRITHPKPGSTVYDFGQNFAGWPQITVTGPAGSSLKLTPGELLNPDGTVSQRSSGGPQWFSYTLGGTGTETWHPRFSYYGFRFVQVEDAGQGAAAGKAQVLSLRGEAVHSSSRAVGSFESSDPLLNRIHTLIVRAIENNSVSLFTDCPHREKLGWLEETHLLAPSMLYDFDFTKLYAATARNIADAQTTTGPAAGRVPEIAPQYVVFNVDNGAFDDSPEWGSAAVLAPWYVYQRTGDLSAIRAQVDVMHRYVAYLSTRAHDGIIDYGLGDWYDIGPGDPGYSKLTTAGLTATAIYYQDIRALQKAAALLGKTDESRQYARQADEVRNSFNARFFHAGDHRYDKGSQTAQAMPLVLGLVPEVERSAVLEALVSDIRAHNNHVTAGDVGYHYLVEALLEGDRSDVLLDMLERTDTPSYGYQLAQGATSLTEAWDANRDSSQDHFMLGDIEEWFYRGLGGINVDFAGEGSQPLILRPAVVGNLKWVRTSYQSALGTIESSWERGPQRMEYNFTIPPNTAALIDLSSPPDEAVTVNGAAPAKATGVISVKPSGNRLQIEVGSGRYLIRASSPPQTSSLH
jgi:alpha-L-rhamnosidase